MNRARTLTSGCPLFNGRKQRTLSYRSSSMTLFPDPVAQDTEVVERVAPRADDARLSRWQSAAARCDSSG